MIAFRCSVPVTPTKVTAVKRELELSEAKLPRPKEEQQGDGQRRSAALGGDQRGSAAIIDDDVAHVKGCASAACFRCMYLKYKEAWEQQLQIGGVSWIDAKVTSGVWGLGCRICAAAGQRDTFSTFRVASGHLGNLKRHQATNRHAQALAKLGLAPRAPNAKAAPSEEDFQKVLRHILSDGSLEEEGVCGGRWKLRRMIWALAEAKREMDRHFLLRCESIALYQDSRQQMLLVRFAGCTADLVTRRGVLGHVHMVGSGNQAILQGMAKVLDTFASRGFGGPRPPLQGSVAVDTQLREHICSKVELFGTDSAADELLAARLARQPDSLLPNVLTVARDRTHGARRRATWGFLMFLRGPRFIAQPLPRVMGCRAPVCNSPPPGSCRGHGRPTRSSARFWTCSSSGRRASPAGSRTALSCPAFLRSSSRRQRATWSPAQT